MGDHEFAKMQSPIVLLAILLPVAFSTPCCTSCSHNDTQYWALDTPNNQCAETCIDPKNKLLLAELWVLTGGKGAPSTTSTPCADAGFHSYNRTDTLPGLLLDKYLPDAPELNATTTTQCTSDADCYCSYCMNDASKKAPYLCHAPTPGVCCTIDKDCPNSYCVNYHGPPPFKCH